MRKRVLPESVWRHVAGELREVASWLAAGQLPPEQFCATLLTLEAAKVQRHGLAMRGQVLENGRVHVELRSAADDRLCATLDYDSASHDLSVHRLSG